MSEINFEEDAAPLPEDALQRVIALAQRLRSQADELARCEAIVVAAKEAYQQTERTDLPELMKELGIPELKLPDGSTVSAGEDFTASIPIGNMTEAVAWLAARSHDGIVKTNLTIEFDRSERAAADELLAKLSEEIAQPIFKKQTIHSQTLKAYIREQREAGETVPEDLFGIFTFARAKLKDPPKPKATGKRAAKPAK